MLATGIPNANYETTILSHFGLDIFVHLVLFLYNYNIENYNRGFRMH